jgi:hypothetical protein
MITPFFYLLPLRDQIYMSNMIKGRNVWVKLIMTKLTKVWILLCKWWCWFIDKRVEYDFKKCVQLFLYKMKIDLTSSQCKGVASMYSSYHDTHCINDLCTHTKERTECHGQNELTPTTTPCSMNHMWTKNIFQLLSFFFNN